MIPKYDALAADLDLIRRYLDTVSRLHQTTDQRRFAYIASISALYASFETFAEQLAFRFGQLMLSDPKALSTLQVQNLRSKYVQNASALLGKNLGVGRYKEIDELDIAKSLASCLGDSHPYDLRLEVIALHNSNLRWDAMADLFRWAVPDLPTRIQHADAVRSWQVKSGHGDATLPTELLARELADLVERRNEVSHRAIPDEIVSPEQLLAKVDFIEAMSLGLVASLSCLVLEASRGRNESEALGVPTEYYQRGRIVVIPTLGAPVGVGDVLWASNGRVARWGRLREIQLDGLSVPRVDSAVEAGLKLEFAVPRNSALYVWRTPDAEFVEPPAGIFGDRGPLASEVH
ncbi:MULTISPECIES: HEPN domain-containing protein [Mycobacterium avium complex (MAC)]|uniref:RiboL-PSP-HEPN domain-containing protein n=1 Tax=Mycobacterium paraintracellulare TaxID=1138383 RepID=A0ABM7KAV6_9MYCO|nr:MULTISPECIES: HEPN domain-containing protein [Mycobacterium avium complex (MAC)]AFC53135.1 hypothetical protein OCQ_16230 [Mycobacterium paraintracellulare]MEE3755012.1 HEPN domain-containing protein [Mycobacterium intracellulare]OSC24580.1 hypothetical protein B8W68_16280 [Mycobacterium paraintracellulare]BBY71303.1 hypothetical protein MPRI_34900 [Mycobacterium paraintracellulare]